jgi:vacuolar-type H+-ATPase subunit E/Vma4
LQEFVKLTGEELAEIKKASNYYERKIFEHPAVVEAVSAYPGDPDVVYLLSAAERLVEGLYHPCLSAA